MMTEEGELKKRMKSCHHNDDAILEAVEKNPQIPLNQYHHGYVKGFAEAEKMLFEFLDAVKKDIGLDRFIYTKEELEAMLKNPKYTAFFKYYITLILKLMNHFGTPEKKTGDKLGRK